MQKTKPRRFASYSFIIKICIAVLFVFSFRAMLKESRVWFARPLPQYRPKSSVKREEALAYSRLQKLNESKVFRSRPQNVKTGSEPLTNNAKAKKSETELAQERERQALEFGFNNKPRPEYALTVADRVEAGVVVALKPLNTLNNGTEQFVEIYIPKSRFKILPVPGDPLVINTITNDVLTPNIGKTLICQVKFVCSGQFGAAEAHTFTYREKCLFSGLYNNPDDKHSVLRARKKFYEAARKDEIMLRKKRPEHNVYIQHTLYYTDLQADKEALTSYVRYVSYNGPKNSQTLSSVLPQQNKIPSLF